MEFSSGGNFADTLCFSPSQMLQDAWIGGDISTETDTQNDELNFTESSNFEDLRGTNPLFDSDEDLDRVVRELFQNSSSNDQEMDNNVPTRTPSPPQDLFFEEGGVPQILTTSYMDSFRVPSPPIYSNSVLANQSIPRTASVNQSIMQQYFKDDTFSSFTRNLSTPGNNIGYVATTFAPYPLPADMEPSEPYGFYTSLSIPHESVVNASSFTAREATPLLAELLSRPPLNAIHSASANENNGLSKRQRDMIQKREERRLKDTTTPFYQPTIRNPMSMMSGKRSVHNGPPLINELLKSQANYLSQSKELPSQPVAAKKTSNEQGAKVVPTKPKIPGVVTIRIHRPKEIPKVNRRKQVLVKSKPPPILKAPEETSIITLDNEEVLEEMNVVESLDSSFVSHYNPPDLPMPANHTKNPSVIAFPNMRDYKPFFTITNGRPALCEQSRTIVGRVLAYNKEVRNRMGHGYVGPWLSPVKLTSYMTGVSTTIVKSCEEFAIKPLHRCVSELEDVINKRGLGNSHTTCYDPYSFVLPPQKMKPPFNEKIIIPKPPPVPQPIPPHRTPFDWSSLYNGQPKTKKEPNKEIRKRSLFTANLLKDGAPEEKYRRVEPVVKKQDNSDKVIRNLLASIVSRVCMAEKEDNRKAIMEKRVSRVIPSEVNLFPDDETEEVVATERKIVARPSSIGVKRGRPHASVYNFRPRDSITKKRFSY